MHPKDISIADFSYPLADEKIAKHPATERDGSKLLWYKEGDIKDYSFKDLPELLPANSLLVFNNAKVVQARLFFYKNENAKPIEAFCLDPDDRYPDMQIAYQQHEEVYWKCMVGGAAKWKGDSILTIENKEKKVTLHAQIVTRQEGIFILKFWWSNPSFCFLEVLEIFGSIPLPPYLNRLPQEEDARRYQTTFAKEEGSVAAPTAALHFTPQIFEHLTAKNIRTAFTTLHVGAGTFKPVKAETMAGHDMHAEAIEIQKVFVEQLLTSLSKTIIAVGTTSLRTLETIYCLGCKIATEKKFVLADTSLSQWEAYDEKQPKLPVADALNALLEYMETKGLERLVTKTQIIIAPGYTIRMVQGLITNFHQPQSTLLLLVAALVGGDWKAIYEHALANNYRFLSYGDSSLLWSGQKL